MRYAVLGLTTVLAASATLSPTADAADGLRIATYNITNYGGQSSTHLANVVYGVFNGASMDPDVIMLQEIETSGALNVLVSTLNSAAGSPGDWTAAPFYSGGGGGINTAVVYRAGKLDLIGAELVAPAGGTNSHPRNIVRYDLRLDGYLAEETAMSLYPVHMKAGSGSSDQSRRLVESQKIRDDAETLPDGRHVIVAGDFNIQSAFQAAYQELVGFQANNRGRVLDPINAPGSWNNSFTYRNIHTQDPVGGGGMDDRLDQILISAGFGDGVGFEYVGQFQTAWDLSTPTDPNHSYRCWGNDGSNYNQALRTFGNTMVGQSIAQSIIIMGGNTGHCPVYLDTVVPAKVGADAVIDLGTVGVGEAASADLSVFNAADAALWGVPGIQDLSYTLTASAGLTAPAGTFTDAAGGGVNTHTITADTSVPGAISGTITIASDDPDLPSRVITVTGLVEAAPCVADLAAPFGVLDLADINAFTSGFFTNDPIADLAPPAGVFDLSDINAFVDSFTAGCP